jgi:WD40 repeat protein
MEETSMSARLFGPGLIAALTLFLPAGGSAGPPPLTPERLARLVEDLGDDDFATREIATRELARFNEAARAVLQKAARSSPDLEIRRRAERILQTMGGTPLPPGALMRIGTLRFRSEDDILAFALAPDGRTFVTNGPSNSAELLYAWSAETGLRLRPMAPPRSIAQVLDLKFNRDGRRLLALGHPADGAHLFAMPSGAHLPRLRDYRPEHAAALSPDGLEVALLEAVSDNPVKLGLRIRGAERRYLSPLPRNAIPALRRDYLYTQARRVAYSRSGHRLATWGAQGHPIRVYDLKGKRPRLDLDGHPGRVEVCVFSPDESSLASAGPDRTVRIWDLKTRKVRLRLPHPAGAFDVAFSPDGRSLVTTSGWEWVDGQHQPEGIRSWDATTGKERWRYPGFARRVAVSSDGKRVYAAGEKVILVLDAATGKPLHPAGHEGPVTALTFSPNGREIVSSGGWGGQVCVWCATTGLPLRQYRSEPAAISLEVRRGQDGKLVSLDHVSVSEKRAALVLRDLASGWALQRVGPMSREELDWGRAFFPIERAGAWELGRARPENTAVLLKTVLAPDGKTVARCLRGEPLRLMDGETAKVVRTFGGKVGGSFPGAVFSPDGKVLAEMGRILRWEERKGSGRPVWENYVRLWEVATGRELRRWASPEGGYNAAAAISPGARLVAVGGSAGTIHVFDAATGKEAHCFEGPVRKGSGNPVCALAFSPDGKVLASGHGDTTVLLWDVSRPKGK